MNWSSDGRFILYAQIEEKTGYDVWALPLFGERKPFPVLITLFDERYPQFSPDGRWVAYQSNESGQDDIYVQPFPGPGERSRISTNGGAQVRRRRDGRELFYMAPDPPADGRGCDSGIARGEVRGRSASGVIPVSDLEQRGGPFEQAGMRRLA